MFKTYKYFLAVLFIGSIGLNAFARDSVELKKHISHLVTEKTKIEKVVIEHKQSLDSILERIKTAKKLQKQHYSIFREFGLQKLLTKAQGLTHKISDIASQQATIEKTLKNDRELLFLRYNSEIENLLEDVKNDPSRKTGHLVKLKTILTERSELTHYLSPVYRESVDSFYIDPTDSYENVLAKAGLLEDYKKRLKKELQAVEAKLSALKRQSFALNEISHLLEEESFFTETGFLKSAQKQSTQDNNSSVTTKTGEMANETQDSGTETEGIDQNTIIEDLPQAQSDEIVETSQTMGDNVTDEGLTQNDTLAALDSPGGIEGTSLKTDLSPSKSANLAPDSPTSSQNDMGSQNGETDINKSNLADNNLHLDTTSKNVFSRIRTRPGKSRTQINDLEKERANLLKLINEIETKRTSMENEARRLHILKMK